jgi:signal transduction histidine kinase/CheY-like chemotaxis protein
MNSDDGYGGTLLFFVQPGNKCRQRRRPVHSYFRIARLPQCRNAARIATRRKEALTATLILGVEASFQHACVVGACGGPGAAGDRRQVETILPAQNKCSSRPRQYAKTPSLATLCLMSVLHDVLSIQGFEPHGYCLLWNRWLISLHVLSDAIIGLSYVGISATLVYLLRRGRRELPFAPIFLAFGVFILACGATHFIDIYTLWVPRYWLQGYVKAVTAAASLGTAISLPFFVSPVITTLRSARAELESKGRLRAMLEANIDSVMLLEPVRDAEGTVRDFMFVEVNARAAKLFGQTLEDLLAHSLSARFPMSFSNGSFEKFVKVLETGELLEEELPVAFPGSSATWVFRRLVQVGDRVLIVARDETAKMELAQMRREVERIDAESRAKADEQARQTEKLDAISQLAGGVAHDFNNLLTAIGGSVEFLREALPVTHACRDDVEQIGDAAERAAGLTRQLLAFGRRQMLETRRTDPNRVITELTRTLSRLLGPGVDLRLVLDATAGEVLADQTQLEQVIINLCSNARDAMTATGHLSIETVRVHLLESLAHRHGSVAVGDYVSLTIRDDGIGMDEMTLARMFEPFFTTKPSGQGTGLGLSTVFGIVKQMHGHVVVHSVPGSGSTFQVFLPAMPLAGLIPDAPAVPAGAIEPPRGGVIVVVDDEPAVRKVMLRIVTRMSYRAMPAGNGMEALDAIARLAREEGISPMLVITDLQMPEMNGRELGDALALSHPKLPVLYVSGFSEDEIFARGLLDETRTLVRKPFTGVSLAVAVQAMVSGSRELPVA